MKLYELYKKYEAAREAADRADDLWGADPENAELEDLFDSTYKAQHKAFTAVTEEIMRLTGIGRPEARILVMTKGKELKSLLAKTRSA